MEFSEYMSLYFPGLHFHMKKELRNPLPAFTGIYFQDIWPLISYGHILNLIQTDPVFETAFT